MELTLQTKLYRTVRVRAKAAGEALAQSKKICYSTSGIIPLLLFYGRSIYMSPLRDCGEY
jgi:hypothetical protein